MNNIEYQQHFSDKRNPLIALIVAFLFVVAGVTFIGPILGMGGLYLVYGIQMDELSALMNHPQEIENGRQILLLYQVVTSIGSFFSPVLLYFYAFEKKDPFKLLRSKNLEQYTVFASILAVFSFMIVNTVFIEWNSTLHFPEVFQGFEHWARQMEDKLKELTDYLTVFDSTSYFIAALVVVAVIPAIVEEYLFRGLLQNLLYRISRNQHAAIWIAALVFSTIHLQFFGFLPRLLLGAVFGYLYVWSGSLWLSILGHFINNGLSLFILYLYQKGQITFDVDSQEAAPWYAILIFGIIFIFSMLYIYKYYSKQNG